LQLEEELHRRAFRAGPSLSASRRVGWVAPAFVAKSAKPAKGAAPNATAFDPPLPSEIDTVRMALLRIDFLSDRRGSASTGTGRFNFVAADTFANPVDPPPHDRAFYRSHAEALTRYYSAQSYGRIHVQVDVWPSEQDSAYHLSDMEDLGPWRFGPSIFEAAVDMMHKCFFAADSQSIVKGDRVPWNSYDRFLVVHAGGDLQSDIRQDSPLDIPSFTMFVDDTDRVVFPDSINKDRPIDRVCFVPETINQDDAYGALNGVIAHESGHNLFGFGDIYDTQTALPVVGWWSLMDSGNLVGSLVQKADSIIFAVGLLPPSVDPFQRNFILDQGLLQFRTPGSADTAMFTLKGSQRTNDFVKLAQSSDEYVILENRYLAPCAGGAAVPGSRHPRRAGTARTRQPRVRRAAARRRHPRLARGRERDPVPDVAAHQPRFRVQLEPDETRTRDLRGRWLGRPGGFRLALRAGRPVRPVPGVGPA
jgi:M6 family metalloprotease-like protein